MSVVRGRRVLDLSTDVAGLYAGRLLARHGFEVTRVRVDEPSAMGSMVFDGPAAGEGPFRRWLDRGVAEVRTTDQGGLTELVFAADIVLSTYAPAVLDALELRCLLRPGTTLVSVTPYGLIGPRAGDPATEQTLFAGAGAMLISGPPAGPPLAPALPIPSILGGTYAAMAATLDWLRGGQDGGIIDLSLHEILAVNTERVFSWYSYLEAIPYRGVGSGRIEQASGGGFLRAADGWFYVFSGYQWFPKVAELVGRPDLVDAVGNDPAARRAGAERINAAIADAVATFTVAELTERAAPLRMPSGPVNTPSTLLRDTQLASRNTFTDDAAEGLDFAEPFRITEGPARTDSMAVESRAGGGRRALAGMRVVDLTHAFAGPATSRILGEAGAEVIKIESPSHLDLLARGMALFDNDTNGQWWDSSGYYGERNLGKRSITLDLAADAGRTLFLDLLSSADVLVSNFTPRVLRGWGLTPEVLHAHNPRLVILLMSGFGLSGPRADNPALAGTMESASGFSSLVRASAEQPPGALGFNFGDMVSGVCGAGAALFALAHRVGTGRGQVIDFACAEAPIPFLAAQLLHAHATGVDSSPDQEFFTSGRHVLIEAGAGEGQRWVLAHVPAATPADALPGIVDAEPPCPDGVVRTALDRTKVLELLDQAGVLAVAVADAEDLWHDPALRARGAFVPATRHGFPTLPYPRAVPGVWDGAPVGPAIAHIPSLGEDNAEVLTGLGVAPEELVALERDGVTGSRPRGKLPRTFTVPLALDDLEALGLIRRVPGARQGLIESFTADRPAPK
jgi:crotonobetainyl-CoA:carnitine CoA-transferase CaiB-like acyl-CoA transferase